MDIEQPLMSGKISSFVDSEGVSSDKERTLLGAERATVVFARLEGPELNARFMSLAEREVSQAEEGTDRERPEGSSSAAQKTFVSVASVSVTNVRAARSSLYETDPDDSADNLEYSKPSSGFSGDDEASCGEDEPRWSAQQVPRVVDTPSDDEATPLLGDIEVRAQVHRGSGDEDSSNDERARLNVSKNSDDSFSELQDVTGSSNTTTAGETQNPPADKKPEPASKPTRIPWTTRLIQKLTEEENRKKLRSEESLKQARKTRIPPKRSAIYERTDKSSKWLTRQVPSSDTITAPITGRAENQGTGGSTERGRNNLTQEAGRQTNGEGVNKVVGEVSDSDLKSDKEKVDAVIPKTSKDRYAEIISALVVEEDTKLTDISDESEVTGGNDTETSQGDARSSYRPGSVLSYSDLIDELPSLRSPASRRTSPANSEPKLSPHSLTNTKRSPQSDSSNEASPSRRPYIETAFLSNSPPRNQDTEEDLMFRKLEAKFSSGPRRQKSIVVEESKPKISPKPDTKTSLPIYKRATGSAAKKPVVEDPRNRNGDLNPVYANDVFFRKKRQQAGPQGNQQIYYSDVESSIELYEDSPHKVRESKINGRAIGYRVSPNSKEAEHLPRGKPIAIAQINSNSVEYRKGTQFEANHVNDKSQKDEHDFAQKTNSKFNEYVKDYKDFHPNNRSSSSSTSTIVSEAPWNPDSVDLEKAAISGSPEIRKLQLKQRPEYEIVQNGEYADRSVVNRVLYYNEEQRLRSQLPLKIQTDNFVGEQQYQPGRSGRLSAPPVPYYEYSRRLKTPEPVKAAAPHHSSPKQAAVGDPQNSPRENYHPVPQQRNLFSTPASKSQKYYSLDAENQSRGHVLLPVAAHVKITSPRNEVQRGGPITGADPHRASGVSPQQKQSPRSNEAPVKLSPNRPQSRQEEIYYERMQKTMSLPAQQRQSPRSMEVPQKVSPNVAQKTQEEIYFEQIQKTRSLPPQTANYRPANPNEVLNRSFSPTRNFRKLSRQEVEQLYWQTQQMRELHAAQLSPRSAQIYMSQYPSTGSLQSTSSLPAPQRRPESQPVLGRNVPNLKVKPVLASPVVSSVPNLNRGSPQLVYYMDPRDGVLKPQPIYNNQAPPGSRQVYLQNMHDGRIRSRSVSPGPNNKYYLNQSPRAVVPQRGSPQLSPGTNFVRGSPQRNTIGAIRSSQPQSLHSTTIYENTSGVFGPQVQLRHPDKLRIESPPGSKIPNGNAKSEKAKQDSSKKSKEEKKKDKKSKDKERENTEQYYPPIFKRGSLSVSNSSVDDSNESPTIPKRVSFSSGRDSTGVGPEQVYWPTRNGLAPEPPTRQHKQRPDSGDSEVFLPNSPGQYYRQGEYIYMNVGVLGDAPDRPLPPLPAVVNSPYGSINKTRETRPANGDFERPAVAAVRGPAAAAPYPAGTVRASANRWQPVSESESGSEAGEVQRILQQGNRNVTYFRFAEEEWGADGKPRGAPGSDQSGSSGGGRDDEVRRSVGARGSRRDEPRRHTLSGDHHHQGGSLARSMDLESPLPRGYPPPSSAMLFDDDPGIMSEVETSSTGFRRGGKQRSSLPVVRTPSKTLERPLGLVFLQYRNETKRALLPNEITSLDTVRALFVRSFPKQLTMEYLDSHHVKIYIHDSSKDMFYELEDLRSHLRDIRDRSVLRLFESADVNGGVLPGAGVGVAPPIWDQDQSYFSEPEFDSEYQHQHIHKSKTSSKSSGAQPYYMTHSYPPGGAGSSATLPRGGSLVRTYSPAVPPPLPADRIKTLPQTGVGPPPKPVRTYHQAQGLVARGNQPIYGSFVNCADRRDQSSIYASPDRLHVESGYMSSPERGGPRGSYPPGYLPSGGPGSYEDPYYSQYAPRSGSITPVIDEEARASLSRIRVEHMERQLANLTGLVQKALTHTPTPREYLQVPVPSSRDANNYRNAADDYDKHSSSSSASLPDEAYLRTDTKPPKLGKDKSVSFEKSVSFSDEPPDMNSPKQHSPQHAERNDRDRHKPAPPPKPVSLSPAQYEGRHIYRDLQMTPELYNQLRGLQKKAKDLRTEVRNLRRMSQAQAHSVRETIRDTFIKIRAVLVAGGADVWSSSGDHDKLRLTREEDLYKQEMLRLETDLTELESTVEELRGNVINRKTRVNMSDVENMALILSKSSKTVADLKVRFPGLQDGMKGLITSEMEKVVREEKFLNEEPERLESALRRCKKLTGTLVTLKRLASVQEQRLPPSSTPESRLSPTMGDSDSTPPITPPAHGKAGAVSTRGVVAAALSTDSLSRQRPENALDALLDELQTFARPPSNPSLADIGRKGSIDSQHPPTTGGTLRRLHSYPSSSDGGGSSPPTLSRLQVTTSPKPPVPERNAELLAQLAGRRQPPPPPPRTSSRSPLASPTSPSLPPRSTTGQPQMGVSGTLRRGAPGRSSLREPLRSGSLSEARPTEETNPGFNPLSASNSSSCESVNSQEGLQPKSGKQRQEVLEQRHQELLRKQKALQEQYARLQQLQRGAGSLSVPQPDLLLKKTGSESNLLAKMGLGHNLSAAAPISGSLTHLAVAPSQPITSLPPLANMKLQTAPTSTTTTNKIYETDIL